MHGLLTSWGTLGNYIFIMLICSSNLFKVTVIKITFSPPRSKRNSRDLFLMLLPRSSPPLSFIFLSLSLSNCNAQLACRERERQWGLFGENSSHVRGWKMASSTNRGIDRLIVGGGGTTLNVTEISRQVKTRGISSATFSFFSRKSGLVIITVCILQVCVCALHS